MLTKVNERVMLDLSEIRLVQKKGDHMVLVTFSDGSQKEIRATLEEVSAAGPQKGQP